jgi:hypothetical protein
MGHAKLADDRSSDHPVSSVAPPVKLVSSWLQVITVFCLVYCIPIWVSIATGTLTK